MYFKPKKFPFNSALPEQIPKKKKLLKNKKLNSFHVKLNA